MNINVFQPALDYISWGIGIIAALIILYVIRIGAVGFIIAEFRNFRFYRAGSINFQGFRHDIGFHLILGLEFLIAADIIRTIVRPTLKERAVLSGIVAIRTLLSYFLGREINLYKGLGK